MELIRTGVREVKFYLDIAFLSQYELDIETFEKKKPFTAKIVDDLLIFANEKCGLILMNLIRLKQSMSWRIVW